jgi:hypothetical protein
MLKWEILLGALASGLAVIAFMAKAYANIREGRRRKRWEEDMRRSLGKGDPE